METVESAHKTSTSGIYYFIDLSTQYFCREGKTENWQIFNFLSIYFCNESWSDTRQYEPLQEKKGGKCLSFKNRNLWNRQNLMNKVKIKTAKMMPLATMLCCAIASLRQSALGLGYANASASDTGLVCAAYVRSQLTWKDSRLKWSLAVKHAGQTSDIRASVHFRLYRCCCTRQLIG